MYARPVGSGVFMDTIKTMNDPVCEETLLIQGMDCASCVRHVEKAVRQLPGVKHVAVNLALGRAQVRFDPQSLDGNRIADAVSQAGYPARVQEQAATDQAIHDDAHARHARGWLVRGIIALVLWLPVEITHWVMVGWSGHDPDRMTWLNSVALVTSTLAIVGVGGAFYRSAFAALRRRTSNMDTLISMGATVAYGYSLIAFIGYQVGWWTQLPHLYFTEGTALLALISLGHWLEARARTRAGSAIRDLMHLAPSTAWRMKSDKTSREIGGSGNISLPIRPEYEEVSVAELQIGDTILVRPGDRVPIDAQVINGRSSVDESMLTGESVPVIRQPGDMIIGGTQNLDGALNARVLRTGSQTALAQIVSLVENAQNSKPQVQRLADRISAVFVPTVLVIAFLTGIGWYVHGQINNLSSAQTWANLAKAVCSVLIIACPCALGLAVPAALMVGTGRGAKLGILFRDINALQSAERIDTVVLDKTGTLTRGRPVVQRIVAFKGGDEKNLLQIAASVEQFSSHPLARAIVSQARSEKLSLIEPDELTNEPGSGIRARVNGTTVRVGSASYMNNPVPTDETSGASQATTVWVEQDDVLLGKIELMDELKPDSSQAVRQLQQMGLKTILLTGDHEKIARVMAERVGIDDWRANTKPGDKASVIKELQQNGRSGTGSVVAMVGDGINDAPALAQADLGIAIGSGADIAKETGGIVLVSGSLNGVPTAIKLSRATMRIIRMNLFFAFIYNILAIPIATLGLLSPIICAAAMALSDITVIGNALRLKQIRL